MYFHSANSLKAFSLTLHQRWLLAAFVMLKLALIGSLPLTGDEAYFIVWGQELALGYYDHPPMVGWVLWALGGLADDLVFYRMFAFWASVLIAWLLYLTLRLHPHIEQTTALWVALAFFVSPISLMFVITANDTVLVFFSVVGFYFFAKALAKPGWWAAGLAGLFLGLAFLSKYFAAFMLLGLLAYSAIYWKRHNLRQIALMVSIVLLFVAENLYFNATHCWNNILFNFFSRTSESAFGIQNLALYLVMIAALLSPLGVFYWLRDRAWGRLNQGGPVMALTGYATLPLLGILLLVSFVNTIGLHWPLMAVTLLYLWYGVLAEHRLQSLYRFNAYSSLVIGVALLVALAFVDRLISPSQKHHVVVYTQPEKVCAAIPTEGRFFTLDYSSQSTLAYHCGNDDIHVFMSKSKYGREDDKKTDFKKMDGQDLRLFLTHEKEIERVAAFFDSYQLAPLQIDRETTYYWLEGQGFDYAKYREEVLRYVNEAFYTAPEWFPVFTESCEFKRKYDFD